MNHSYIYNLKNKIIVINNSMEEAIQIFNNYSTIGFVARVYSKGFVNLLN